MSSRSKRYKSNLEKFDLEKTYLLDEGIDLIKENSNIKFDETSYPINAEWIEEFANFAEHSGGFRIN